VEDLYADERIVLKWMLMTEGGKVWNGLMWLMIGTRGALVNTIINLPGA
jgi:hypothetical protein